MSRKRPGRHRAPSPSPPVRTPRFVDGLLLAGLGAALVAHMIGLRFVQDDSFITFRYVRNMLDGNGLVFNAGEHVEGYTNFLWTVLLGIPGALGIDLITASHLLGVLAALAALGLLSLLSLRVGGKDGPFALALVAPALLVANGAAAYWFISGMETALFTALLLASVLVYLNEYRGTIRFAPLLMVLLSLTRPEGMLVFSLTVLHYVGILWLDSGSVPVRTRLRPLARLIGYYAVPMALFVGWRLAYYGHPFPNTYYAKAGVSSEYLQAGIDYLFFFLRTYMLHGLLLALPAGILLWRRRSAEIVYLVLLALGYSAYIVSVGGDVLHAFRFFVPLLPLFYLLMQESLRELLRLAPSGAWRHVAPVAVAVLLAAHTYLGARDYITEKWMLEQGLVSKMTATGSWLASVSGPTTQVAASTIGALSYYSGVTLIDLLGLTDETIAHDPEPIEGVESGWKERKYNTSYVLSRDPDWIFFSTGTKPSAFAERALFTRAEFRRRYYPCLFHLNGDIDAINVAYKRSPEALVDTARFSGEYRSVAFINEFYIGMNMLRTPGSAFPFFEKARREGPADFALLEQQLGEAYRGVNNEEAAEQAYRRAVAINPAMVESQMRLGLYARSRQDADAARHHFAQVVRYNPEFTWGWTLLGETLLLEGDSTAARPLFERAMAITPNNTHARGYLTRLGPAR